MGNENKKDQVESHPRIQVHGASSAGETNAIHAGWAKSKISALPAHNTGHRQPGPYPRPSHRRRDTIDHVAQAGARMGGAVWQAWKGQGRAGRHATSLGSAEVPSGGRSECKVEKGGEWGLCATRERRWVDDSLSSSESKRSTTHTYLFPRSARKGRTWYLGTHPQQQEEGINSVDRYTNNAHKDGMDAQMPR